MSAPLDGRPVDPSRSWSSLMRELLDHHERRRRLTGFDVLGDAVRRELLAYQVAVTERKP